MPVHGTFGTAIPAAQDHLDGRCRVVAIVGNSLGTIAVVAVALATFRRRPLGNALVLAGIAVAAIGSAFSGLGVSAASGFALAAVVLLYLGAAPPRPAVVRRTPPTRRPPATPGPHPLPPRGLASRRRQGAGRWPARSSRRAGRRGHRHDGLSRASRHETRIGPCGVGRCRAPT